MVVARFVNAEAHWNVDGTRIETHATYAVERTLSSKTLPDLITVRFAGGRVGDIAQILIGGPSLDFTERDLLFLEHGEGNVFLAAGRKGYIVKCEPKS